MEQKQSDDLSEQNRKIIEQLKLLNTKIEKQNSVRHIFLTAIIYGVGAFVGSAILATIAFGILSPWFGQIEWVKDNYERGASLRDGS